VPKTVLTAALRSFANKYSFFALAIETIIGNSRSPILSTPGVPLPFSEILPGARPRQRPKTLPVKSLHRMFWRGLRQSPKP